MSQLEAHEEARVVKWCKDHNILCIKFTPMGSCGWPDRIVVMPNGFHVWLELKRRGKKPRRLQTYRMQQLMDHGAVAAWFDSADKTIAFLQDVLTETEEALDAMEP